MNREILFRVWVKAEKKMGEVYRVTFPKHQYTFVNYRYVSDQGKTIDGGAYINHGGDTVVLMQYTGLKDKNGVKIFEGDILRTHFEFSPGDAGYNDSQRPFVVEWDEDRMCFRDWKPGVDRHSHKLLEIIDFFGKQQEEVYEVIGNIYDNPELLEVLGDE